MKKKMHRPKAAMEARAGFDVSCCGNVGIFGSQCSRRMADGPVKPSWQDAGTLRGLRKAGTVIGAGLVSALVTVLSAVYAHGARRAREKLQARIDAVRSRGPLPASYADGTASTGPGGDPSAAAADRCPAARRARC